MQVRSFHRHLISGTSNLMRSYPPCLWKNVIDRYRSFLSTQTNNACWTNLSETCVIQSYYNCYNSCIGRSNKQASRGYTSELVIVKKQQKYSVQNREGLQRQNYDSQNYGDSEKTCLFCPPFIPVKNVLYVEFSG